MPKGRAQCAPGLAPSASAPKKGGAELNNPRDQIGGLTLCSAAAERLPAGLAMAKDPLYSSSHSVRPSEKYASHPGHNKTAKTKGR
jgi:hypothetical protein